MDKSGALPSLSKDEFVVGGHRKYTVKIQRAGWRALRINLNLADCGMLSLRL